MLRNTQRIHFVGIGGIGMSGIAEVLLHLGYTVTGSDLVLSDVTKRLQQQGATVYQARCGARAGRLRSWCSLRLCSRTMSKCSTARTRHIPVIPRAEMLAELMRRKYGSPSLAHMARPPRLPSWRRS